MPKLKSQQAYWNSRAKSWGTYGEPLIPSQPELAFQRQQLTPNGNILILGVTPQLCALALEVSNSVTAVDFAQDLIDALRIDGVEYVCQDWLTFLEESNAQYDAIITDGGLLCMQFPDNWNRLGELIYSRLRPGGVFCPRVYLSTENQPKAQYDNPNLARFMPSLVGVDDNWMVQVATHQDYAQYDIAYAFPPRDVVLQTFNQFVLKDEFTPEYEEGDRFVSFAFQKHDTLATESDVFTTNLYIGGEHRDTKQTLTIVDPAQPGVTVGHAAAASPKDVSDAISAAQTAFPAWAALTPQERAAQMLQALTGLAENRDDDAALLSQEIGKIRHEAWVDSLVLEIRWQLALAHAGEVSETKVLKPVPGHIPTETTVAYQPLGVVTIIVPFNWPVAILGASLPQALLAGNTVIVKPPLTAPLGTTRIIQRIAEQLPPGVLNVVTGEDATMSALIQDSRIAKVCFTGSVGGGKKIMELASKNLTRLTLELGGNDPAIILKDALLDDTHIDRLFAAMFDTTGQICMNAKRIFVHQSRVDEVVNALSTRLEKVVLGHGLDEHTTMGPLHAASQKQYVNELIEEAKASGAKVLEFGTLPGGELQDGNFVRPALIINPKLALRIVTEEQFGPIIPIIPFTSEDEAVALANDTWGGLCSSVWTEDAKAADRVANQLACGYVWINDHGATRLDLRAPFGGMKQSGFGREQGIEGIRAFQDTRSVARLDS